MASAAAVGGVGSGRLFSPMNAALFILSLATGCALFALDGSPRTLFIVASGVASLAVLLAFPELALALYVVVGDVKGDDRVASLIPADLTLVLAAILLAGIALNFLRGKRIVAMPPIYFVLLALAVLIIVLL